MIKKTAVFPVLIIAAIIGFSCSNSDRPGNSSEIIKQSNIPKEYKKPVAAALEKSGSNRPALEEVLLKTPADQKKGAAFLLAHMPEHDLQSLSAAFILENIRLAYAALDGAPWSEKISEQDFLNYILPYANIHERRDNWRGDFRERFYPLALDCETPGEAAVKINTEMWDMVNVHYSTERPKADQSPYESIDATLASCTGLTILLVDACRAVGIPARFAGIGLWVDKSGNHSWVEVWDEGSWHCLGAGEPGPLNETWFIDKASRTNPDDPKHWIYAVSYEQTDLEFPVLWDTTVHYVSAVNVTDNYVTVRSNDAKVNAAFRLFETEGGKRISADAVLYLGDEAIGKGQTRDEQNDLNDMLNFDLLPGKEYTLALTIGSLEYRVQYKTTRDKYQVVDLVLGEIEKVQ